MIGGNLTMTSVNQVAQDSSRSRAKTGLTTSNHWEVLLSIGQNISYIKVKYSVILSWDIYLSIFAIQFSTNYLPKIDKAKLTNTTIMHMTSISSYSHTPLSQRMTMLGEHSSRF